MESAVESNLIFTIAVGTLALFVLVAAVLTFFVLYQKRILKSIEEKKELETQYQKELLHKYIEAQEKERKRIAADLHDDIGANLAAVKMILNQMELNKSANLDLLKECKDSLQLTVDSARQISHNLMPPALETIGLLKVLERLAKNLSNDNFNLNISAKDAIRFTTKVELALYRVMQELINNTIKYSKANKATITFNSDNDHHYVRYADNGVGYSFNAKSDGLGLKNIESRIQMIHGDFQFFSKKNEANGIQITLSKN